MKEIEEKIPFGTYCCVCDYLEEIGDEYNDDWDYNDDYNISCSKYNMKIINNLKCKECLEKTQYTE